MNPSLTQLEHQAQKAMMNPHFIFNVINSIQHYINGEEKEKANFYLAEFARLIRISSSTSGKSEVFLTEELEYLNLYLMFEKLRYGDLLNYEISIDPTLDLNNTSIAVMMIQPFLENAIWHGILPTDSEGKVKLNIEKAPDSMLKITVEDNGIGIEEIFTNNNLLNNESELSNSCIAIQRLKILALNSSKPIYIHYKYLNPGITNKGTVAEFLLPAILGS